MKRTGNLFERIVERENFRLAVSKAARGKRQRPDVRQFVERLDDNLKEMMDQVLAGTYPLGRFRQFVIYDPKERIITAPCFPERVLHQRTFRGTFRIVFCWIAQDR